MRVLRFYDCCIMCPWIHGLLVQSVFYCIVLEASVYSYFSNSGLSSNETMSLLARCLAAVPSEIAFEYESSSTCSVNSDVLTRPTVHVSCKHLDSVK